MSQKVDNLAGYLCWINAGCTFLFLASVLAVPFGFGFALPEFWSSQTSYRRCLAPVVVSFVFPIAALATCCKPRWVRYVLSSVFMLFLAAILKILIEDHLYGESRLFEESFLIIFCACAFYTWILNALLFFLACGFRRTHDDAPSFAVFKKPAILIVGLVLIYGGGRVVNYMMLSERRSPNGISQLVFSAYPDRQIIGTDQSDPHALQLVQLNRDLLGIVVSNSTDNKAMHFTPPIWFEDGLGNRITVARTWWSNMNSMPRERSAYLWDCGNIPTGRDAPFDATAIRLVDMPDNFHVFMKPFVKDGLPIFLSLEIQKADLPIR